MSNANRPSASYIVGDSRRDLAHLKTQVSCVITSPPYYDVRDYGAKEQIGFGQKREEFLADLRLVFDAAHQASTRDGFLWIVADSIRKEGEYVPLPHLFADAARQSGWKFQSSLVWAKDKTYPWLGPGRLRKLHEAILLFSKSADPRLRIDRLRSAVDISEWWLRYPERYNPLGVAPPDIWREPIPTQGSWGRGFLKHECPFPPALVERMIELTTDPGDTVLDPFAGTGVVAATALVMGRSGIAMDVVDKFAAHFAAEVLPAVEHWWRERMATKAIQRVHDEAFFRANLGLRAAKYARLLLESATTAGEKPAGAWIQTGKPRRKTPWISGSVTVFLRDDAQRESLLKTLTTKAGRPPMSKFGAQLSIKLASLRTRRATTRGYLYSSSSTPVSTKRLSVNEFIGLLRSSDRPLLGGNLLISADDVVRVATRGWRDREVNLGLPLDALELFPRSEATGPESEKVGVELNDVEA